VLRSLSTGGGAHIDFRILGPLEVREGDQVLPLHGARERSLLAYLLLHANEVVPTERLIDELWGETPPATVSSALHVYVSRLRKLLGRNGNAIVTRAPGYVLELTPEQLDLRRFEQFVENGRWETAAGNAAAAKQAFDAALELWRGPPLADLGAAPWAEDEARRLEELRLVTIEERIDAELALGRHAEVVPELERLVGRHPLRERLRAQLMLALYRSGRAADALQTYTATRRIFVEELGLEPSEALRRLEQAILSQDSLLDAPITGTRNSMAIRIPRRRGRLVVAVTAALIAAAVAIAVTRDNDRPSPVVVRPDSIAVIDSAKNRLVGDLSLAGRPSQLAAGDGALWIGDPDDSVVLQVDPIRERVVRAIGIKAKPMALAFGWGALWVVGGDQLVRIDPHYDVTATTRLHQHVPGFGPGDVGYDTVAAVAANPAGLWVAHTVSALSRIDPSSARVLHTTVLDDAPISMALTADTVWVATIGDSRVTSVDTNTGNVTGSIPIPGISGGYATGASPCLCGTGVAAGFGSVWVSAADRLWRIDPLTDSATASIRTGDGAAGLAIAPDAVWVTNYLAGTVSRVNPRTNSVVATINVGSNVRGIAVTPNRVWVAVG
jgi:DNA-binding SARP family transcriptional activator